MRFVLALLPLLAACSATRHDVEYKRLDGRTEYAIEDFPGGFYAYVWYCKYQFIGAYQVVADEGKAMLARVVAAAATERGRKVRPYAETEIEYDDGRNFWSVTSWSGKVRCVFEGQTP